MESNISVLVDKSLYAKRVGSPVPGFNSGVSVNNDFLLGSPSQRRRTQGLRRGGVGGGSLGQLPPPYVPYPAPPSTYSSLPNTHILQRPYPPLLPLPISKSVSLPSPSSLPYGGRMVGTVTASKEQQKRPRTLPWNPKKDVIVQHCAIQPQKVLPLAATLPGRISKPPASAAAAAQKPRGNHMDDVYVLSPPPSSLPMPKFFLRPRTPSAPALASCNVEAFSVDGATEASDDLRRLLRL